MSLTVEQFTERVVRAGLLTTAELQEFIAELPPDRKPAKALAQALYKAKRLTRYQAETLYRDKGDPLVLGNYVILDRLGSGGMGEVYKAEHRDMGRIVAVKILKESLTENLRAVQRFQREVRTVARLSHPNIVTAHDASRVGDVRFLVMEYVPGDNLSRMIRKRGPLPVEVAVDCIAQAADGLGYAHGEGIIHRDVKPGNLLLSDDGTVKVLDLGLAGFGANPDGTEPDDEPLTNAHSLVGTADFMAPERATDPRCADHRADIYSLGCTLYYLLTGQVLYPAEYLMQKVLAHRDQPIPSLCDARPDAPPALDAVFRRMVAKSPDDRFQSMAEVAAALRSIGDVGQVETWPDSPAESAWNVMPGGADFEPEPTGFEFDQSDNTPLPMPNEAVAASGGVAIQASRPGASRAGVAGRARQARRLRQSGAMWGIVVGVGLSLVTVFYVVKWVRSHGVGESTSPTVTAMESTPTGQAGTTPIGTTLAGTDGSMASTPWQPIDVVNPVPNPPDAPTESEGVGADDPPVAKPPAARNSAQKVFAAGPPGQTLRLPANEKAPTALAVARNGRLIVSGSEDGMWIGNLVARRYVVVRFDDEHHIPTDDLAVSPDGRLVALSRGPFLAIWNLETNESMGRFKADALDERIGPVAFSADGSRLASGFDDRSLRLWKVPTLELLESTPLRLPGGPRGKISHLFYSPGGTVYARDTEKNLWAWSGGRAAPRVIGRDVERCAIDFERQRLLSCRGAEIVMSDLQSGDELKTWRSPHGAIARLAVLPDGRGFLTSAHHGRTLEVWRYDRDARAFEFTIPQAAIDKIVPTTDGRFAITAGGPASADIGFAGTTDHALRVWRLPLLPPTAADARPMIADARPDGQPDGQPGALPGGEDPFNPGEGNGAFAGDAWQAPDGPPGELFTLAGHTDVINCVAFAPDGRHVLTGGADGFARLWDLEQQTERFHSFFGFHNGRRDPVYDVVISPDGRLAAVGGLHEISVFSLEALRHRDRLFAPKGAEFRNGQVAFSPDSKQLVAEAGDFILIWDAATLTPLRQIQIKRRTGRLNCAELAFVGAETVLVDMPGSGARFATLNLSTGRRDEITVPVGLVYDYHPQRRLLAVADEREVSLSPLEGRGDFPRFDTHGAKVTSVRFLPDGERFVTGSLDKKLRVWRIDRREPVHVFESATACTTHVAISPDGRIAVSGGGGIPMGQTVVKDDLSVHVWRLPKP